MSEPSACMLHSPHHGQPADPIDALLNEHEVILAVLEALERQANAVQAGGTLRQELWRQFLEFLSNFADRCHHGKEERLLFPALAERGLPDAGGPLAVMKAEHEQGRLLLGGLGAAIARADAGAAAASALAFVQLLREHIGKENQVLFPIGRRLLEPQAKAHLARAFEDAERDIMGTGTHCRYLDLAKRICAESDVQFARARGAELGGCCGHGTAAPHVFQPDHL